MLSHMTDSDWASLESYCTQVYGAETYQELFVEVFKDLISKYKSGKIPALGLIAKNIISGLEAPYRDLPNMLHSFPYIIRVVAQWRFQKGI